MKPAERGAHRRWESRRHFVFLGVGGDIYRFHVEVGPLIVAWDRHTWRMTRKAAMRGKAAAPRQPTDAPSA